MLLIIAVVVMMVILEIMVVMVEALVMVGEMELRIRIPNPPSRLRKLTVIESIEDSVNVTR